METAELIERAMGEMRSFSQTELRAIALAFALKEASEDLRNGVDTGHGLGALRRILGDDLSDETREYIG